MTGEMQFPVKCPGCHMLTAAMAEPHCSSPTCPWLRCGKCHIVIDQGGRLFYGGKPA